MKIFSKWLCAGAAFLPLCVNACIWDADTLTDEKKKSPKLAEVILGPAPAAPDPKPLRERIAKLKAQPKENDATWWNDLAGAHLRLGEAAEAAKLLESISVKFPNDYGIHANLGTAYHLLGRYAEAERHIARDLEINPDGHFGLEKYHLALLRYLKRDLEFQSEHVYLEAWSEPFVFRTNSLFASPNLSPDGTNAFDEQFLSATNLIEGALYMVTLNREQPACWVMLGLLCSDFRRSDLNLSKAAFQRAIQLGSPQRELIEMRIAAINEHIREARAHRSGPLKLTMLILLVLVAVPVGLLLFTRWWRRRRESVAK